MLVNAIHFKDTWLNQFKAADTFKQKFFTSKSSSDEVEMMHKTANFLYSENDLFKVLELPYEVRFSPLVLVPHLTDTVFMTQVLILRFFVSERSFPNADLLA